ncbi:MAG: hypothetical protein C4542_02385 [Dehalococcoidia bacterium]|nr:MAG: hypothetical protein C4542_02385 [Dehalococcoidia bacterium]
MKVLKALASTLLSLLLFLCLTVMGVAITINATALNSGFVTAQIDKLDVVALFNEEVLPELQKDEQLAAHPELISSLKSAVTHNAPALKSAVTKAVSDIYEYLLHGGTLNLRSTLKNSILDPRLAISILNDIDFSTVVRDWLLQSLPPEGVVVAGFNINLTPYIDSIIPVIEPYFKEQLSLLIPKLYDFILGASSALDLSIPISPVLDDIASTLKSAFLASPPPSLAGLPRALLSPAFDIFWAQTVSQMPANIDLNSSEIGLGQPAEIGQALDSAQSSLAEARRWVVYYQEGFWALVGLSVLLILFIILVNRNVKTTCRILGGTFMTYGVTEAAGVIISRGLIHNQMASALTGVPPSMQPWLVQLIDSLMNPLLIFAISCAVLGVILFVVSFLYRRTQGKSVPA